MAARPATSSGPTVVICSQAAPGRMAGAVSRMTSATAAPSKSMVMTTSAPSTAAVAVGTISMPSSARGWAREIVRFQARTAWPAPAMLRAIAEPMIPVPSTATVS